MILRPYQEAGRDFLAGRKFALLADEMRVGKTPQAILAADKIGASRVLVICPAIATTQWQHEWIRWAGTASTVLDRGLWAPVGVVIASYDMATRMTDVLREQRWDLVIADESHYCKNPEAKRTRAVFAKDGIIWHADRLWCLSGTPAPKNASEVWPMLRAFGATDLSYEDFLTRFCWVDPMTGRVLGTRDKAIPEFNELVAKVTLRRTRAQVAPEMPAIDFQYLNVRPTQQQDFIPPPGLSDEQLLDWLLAQAPTVADTRQAIAKAKVPQLADHISGAIENGELTQTVVFGYHISPMHDLRTLLTERGLKAEIISGDTPRKERDRIREDFADRSLDVVLGQIIAAGTAIDLSAARHGYFLELDWVPGNNMQAANRLVSMDKQDKVTFDIVTWPGSIDERVTRVVERRARQVSQLF